MSLPRPNDPSPDAHEIERLRTLRDYRILDTPPEIAFDRITKLAADLLDAPIALVSFNDERRLWFKSAVGISHRETPRENSFCQHALQEDGPMIVSDAHDDDRFRDHGMVTGDPHIRFYAGAPLRAHNGHVLGMLCILDTKPRPALSERDLARLCDLADIIMAEADLRRTMSERDAAKTMLDHALRFSEVAIWQLDSQRDHVDWQGAHAAVWGADSQTQLTSSAAVLDRIQIDDRIAVRTALDLSLAEGVPFADEFRIAHPEKGQRWLAGRAELGTGDQAHILTGINYDVTDQHSRQENGDMLMRELHHRMRNLFATVGAIISLTRHSATDVEDYAERIGNRLDALNRAQNVLLGANFLTGSFHALLREVQAAFPRISWSGPDLVLPENALVAMALVLNELATNAAKYGALSTDDGHVVISWDQDVGDREDRMFRLVWAEEGGQPVMGPPERSSFGTLLMDRSVRNNLGGTIERDWSPGGLVCTITLPARWEGQ